MKQVSLKLGLNRDNVREIFNRTSKSIDSDIYVEGPTVWTGDSRTTGGSTGCPGCLPECPDCLTLVKCAGFTIAEATLDSGEYVIPTGVIDVDLVSFDDLPAIEGDHYTISNNHIIPIVQLIDGTVVTTRYRAAVL